MTHLLAKEERDSIYSSLTDEQIRVLSENIKHGKKTKWLNLWAKKKGVVLSEADLLDPDLTMNKLLEWKLVDYEDAFIRSSTLKCECGRSLRYRYTVKHMTTGVEYKLGINHLKEHTGLDAETVRLITKGLIEISHERDEILGKVKDRWTMPFEIPSDIELPREIQELLNVKLPLLEKHLLKIKDLIKIKNNAQRLNYLQQVVPKKCTHKSRDNNARRTYSFEKIEVRSEEDDIPIANSLTTNDAYKLIEKLKMYKITAVEAKDLYAYLKSNREALSDDGIHVSSISDDANKALGKIGNAEVRKWLIDIIYL